MKTLKKITIVAMHALSFSAMAALNDSTSENIGQVVRVISSTSTNLNNSGSFDDVVINNHVQKNLNNLLEEKLENDTSLLFAKTNYLNQKENMLDADISSAKNSLSTSIGNLKNSLDDNANRIKANNERDLNNHINNTINTVTSTANNRTNNEASESERQSIAYLNSKINWAKTDAKAYADSLARNSGTAGWNLLWSGSSLAGTTSKAFNSSGFTEVLVVSSRFLYEEPALIHSVFPVAQIKYNQVLLDEAWFVHGSLIFKNGRSFEFKRTDFGLKQSLRIRRIYAR